MVKFDLTTEEGMKKAMKNSLDSLFPIPSLMFKIGKAILSRNAVSAHNQKQVAEALIEKGYQNGVEEMVITMDNTTGVKIRIPTEKCDVETSVGGNDKMTLRVKYK